MADKLTNNPGDAPLTAADHAQLVNMLDQMAVMLGDTARILGATAAKLGGRPAARSSRDEVRMAEYRQQTQGE